MVDELLGTLDWDATDAKKTLDEVDKRVEQALEKVKGVKEKQKESFNEVLGMMRSSYMMVSGLSAALGGAIPHIFSSMFGVAISAIATYKAIAAAMAASGVGAAQAAIMFASLITSMTSLVAGMTKQPELTRQMSGLSSALHGISGMISSFSI